MNVLVAGDARVDAGKTTFSTGLIAHLDATGFKPRAGNDYWYDHTDYRRAIEAGRLYGKDAKRLAAASAGNITPEEINPVHRLWRPAPGAGSGLLGRNDREFLLDRVGDRFVVNGTADLPDSAREHLPLEKAVVVETLDECNAVMGELHLPTIQNVTDAIDAADRAVVESYGDVAVPINSIQFDAVAVVEPRRASIYDGDRFLTAHEVSGSSAREGRIETVVEDVAELLEPITTVGLPALADEARADPGVVADAYADAYRAVLEAVER